MIDKQENIMCRYKGNKIMLHLIGLKQQNV